MFLFAFKHTEVIIISKLPIFLNHSVEQIARLKSSRKEVENSCISSVPDQVEHKNHKHRKLFFCEGQQNQFHLRVNDKTNNLLKNSKFQIFNLNPPLTSKG